MVRFLWIGSAAGVGRDVARQNRIGIRNDRNVRFLDHAATIVGQVRIAIVGTHVVTVAGRACVRHRVAAGEVRGRNTVTENRSTDRVERQQAIVSRRGLSGRRRCRTQSLCGLTAGDGRVAAETDDRQQIELLLVGNRDAVAGVSARRASRRIRRCHGYAIDAVRIAVGCRNCARNRGVVGRRVAGRGQRCGVGCVLHAALVERPIGALQAHTEPADQNRRHDRKHHCDIAATIALQARYNLCAQPRKAHDRLKNFCHRPNTPWRSAS